MYQALKARCGMMSRINLAAWPQMWGHLFVLLTFFRQANSAQAKCQTANHQADKKTWSDSRRIKSQPSAWFFFLGIDS